MSGPAYPALKLVWRQYRFEIVTVTIAVLLVSAIAIALAYTLDMTRPTPALLELCTATDGSMEEPGCAEVASWVSLRDTELGRLIGLVPFAAGAILGAALVSREIEHGSAQLGWSLSGRRATWFAERALPAAGLLVVLLLVLTLASEYLEAARQPGVDPVASLHDYGDRGLPILMHGVFVFAGTVLIGSAVGRQLPALVLGGILAVAVGYGLAWAFPFGAPWRWIAETSTRSEDARVASRFGESGFRSPSGTVVSYEEAASTAPPGLPDEGAVDEWIYEHYEPVQRVLEGTQRPEVVAREALLLGVATIMSAGAAVAVIDRRRPY